LRFSFQAEAPGAHSPGVVRALGTFIPHPTARERNRVNAERSERLGRFHRLRSSLEIAEVKASGRVFRGDLCLLLVLARPGVPTRVGFIASKKGVGGAVERNRARRRLREILRRRWPRIPLTGYWILVVAHRGATTALHQELASDLERLLATAGALAPIGESSH
jgi:ribonuclease P protein component